MSSVVSAVKAIVKPPKPPDPPEPVKPPDPPAPEAVAEETVSGKRNERRKFSRRFGRNRTILAGSTPLGANPNKKTLLGE